MYINPHFEATDVALLHELIEAHPFGVLVAPGNPPSAAHIPFVLHSDEGELGLLEGHTARRDPISVALDGTTELRAIFQGPSSYIRSRWYAGVGLPTYNFLAVHALGRAEPIRDREEVLRHLGELVVAHEDRYPDMFSLSEAEPDYLAPLLEEIAPFRLVIDRLEGKRKLSQNRSAADREQVIAGLRSRGDQDDRLLAETMEQNPYVSAEAKPLLPPTH